MRPMLDFFNRQMSYKVLFHVFETKEPVPVYEDRSLTVTTIPLRHRMPCCGFLFAEKPRPTTSSVIWQTSTKCRCTN